MSDMKDKTLLELFNASDEMLADFMREAIQHYFDMQAESPVEIGITATETLKDACIVINIAGAQND